MPKRPPDADSLQALLELHEEPVVLIDDAYTIVAANRAYAENYQVPGDELAGQKCHQVSHHSDVPCHQRGEDCPIKRVRQTGKPVDTLHIHFSGDAVPERVRVRGFPITHHGRWLLAEKIQRLESPAVNPDNQKAVTQMVGESSIFLTLLHRLVQVAAMPGAVLLQGESGAGKELAARFIHEHCANADGPIVVADCTTIPDSLFESELFGHARGAYTGSGTARPGLFETAHGGTLFLDEVGELPLALQSRLLRAIDTGQVRRLGEQQPRHVEVRIVAATNRNLQQMVHAGEFRLDLYYRLATHEVRIPALRERREDIAPIANALLAGFDQVCRPTISHKAIDILRELPLPGNVRELRNLLERALVFGSDIDAAAIHAALHAGRRQGWLSGTGPADSSPDAEPGQAAENDLSTGLPAKSSADIRANRALLLAQSLRRHDGNRARAAADLGVSERTVYRWMKHFCNDPNCT